MRGALLHFSNKVLHFNTGAAGSISAFYPHGLFLIFIVSYVLLQSVATIFQASHIKLLTYALAIIMTLVLLIVALFDNKRALNNAPLLLVILFLYYYGLIWSSLYNIGDVDYRFLVKLLLLPVVLVIGVIFGKNKKVLNWRAWYTRLLYKSLLVLPLFVWFFQLAIGQVKLSDQLDISIFANRNNAALYFIALIALLNVLRGQPVRSILVYLAAGLLFGTMGVLLAVLVALVLTVGRLKINIILFLLVTLVVYTAYYSVIEVGLFARIKPFIDSFVLIASGDVDLSKVAYSELVASLNTTDLSFIFRLKHWYDLLSIYLNSNLDGIVFGLGIGSSVVLSQANLVPHNDYIRVLVECGLITFIGFLGLVAYVLWHCRRDWLSTPFIVIAVYFFSENLLDNFAAMSVFFYAAGLLISRTNIHTGRVLKNCPPMLSAGR